MECSEKSCTYAISASSGGAATFCSEVIIAAEPIARKAITGRCPEPIVSRSAKAVSGWAAEAVIEVICT
jgi:hypothetical protein